MKSKWGKITILAVIGILAMSTGQAFTGSLADITNIVGLVLLILAVVFAFKKEKTPPVV